MKDFFKKRKILIIITVLVILVSSLNFFQKEVKGFFYSFSAPLQTGLFRAGENVSDFFEGWLNSGNLKKEADELKLAVERLMAENALLKEIEQENEFLREALEIGLQKKYILSLAEVVSRDADAVLVNQGSKDGILLDMPVITQQKTLLGRVTEIYDDFAWVTLISNSHSSFDAKVVESGVSGVVKGRGGSRIDFDLVLQDEEISEGEMVVSSSLGGLYPAGLLVSPIEKIEQSDVKPFYQITVIPLFDIQELDKVLIILNF